MCPFGILGVFFWYFQGVLGVFSRGPEFRAGGHFSWKFRVRPFRVSLAGGGILELSLKSFVLRKRPKNNKQNPPRDSTLVAQKLFGTHESTPMGSTPTPGFWLRGTKLRPWSKQSSEQTQTTPDSAFTRERRISDHGSKFLARGKLRPWSEFRSPKRRG